MDNRPIGVFDSGLGGLTAVKKLMSLLPNEDIVYFGDTGRVPYGTRSREAILKYTAQDIRFLLTHNTKMIIIACGTASSAALEPVRDMFDIPIIGVVDASVSAAMAVTKTNHVAVLGTSGTIASGVYQSKLTALGATPIPIACPLFVPLVENNMIDRQATRLIAEEYLAPAINSNVDTIILGCTHYPLLKSVIYDIMGNSVCLIDSGSEAVSDARLILTERNILNDQGGIQKYFVSDSVEGFSKAGGLFLGRSIDHNVKQINIEEY